MCVGGVWSCGWMFVYEEGGLRPDGDDGPTDPEVCVCVCVLFMKGGVGGGADGHEEICQACVLKEAGAGLTAMRDSERRRKFSGP